MTITTFGVIGAGQMGGGIAQVAAASGLNVIMNDIRDEFVQGGLAVIEKNLQRSVGKQKLEAAAKDKILGRLASQVAYRIRGKHNPLFTPHVDMGDWVVVINADKIQMTGKKLDQKKYYRHGNLLMTFLPHQQRALIAGNLLLLRSRILQSACD